MAIVILDGDETLLKGVVIGVSESHSEDQKKSFRSLVHENNEIMDACLKTLILEADDIAEKKEDIIRDIIEEVFF